MYGSDCVCMGDCVCTHACVHACNDLTMCKMTMQHAHTEVGYMSGIGHLK